MEPCKGRRSCLYPPSVIHPGTKKRKVLPFPFTRQVLYNDGPFGVHIQPHLESRRFAFTSCIHFPELNCHPNTSFHRPYTGCMLTRCFLPSSSMTPSIRFNTRPDKTNSLITSLSQEPCPSTDNHHIRRQTNSKTTRINPYSQCAESPRGTQMPRQRRI